MRSISIDPPPSASHVTGIVIFDMTLFESPLSLSTRVTHYVDDDGDLEPFHSQARGIPTLAASQCVLVFMSDGKIARSSISNARRLIRRCGQDCADLQ